MLLGLRTNRPARGTWFVPGGAIRKDESLDQAFSRIARAELALELDRGSARLLGQHFCGDNFAGRDGVSMHYVVLAHDIVLLSLPADAPRKQHRDLRAFGIAELLAHPDVHENTKAYFRPRAIRDSRRPYNLPA